jgi:hypothetical protein
MEAIRPFFPFSGISYLVRFGRKAEVHERHLYLPHTPLPKRYSYKLRNLFWPLKEFTVADLENIKPNFSPRYSG